MKKQLTKCLCLPGVLLIVHSSAWALSYDQSVNANGPAPSNGNAQGIYFGSGNANGSWTVDTANNIELGLRAHVRYPTPENVYNSAGNDVYSFSDSSAISPSGRGSWNYDFSINVDANGLGSATLSQYTYTLAIDSNPGAGDTWTIINPLLIPDNGPVGNTGIAQNSENPGFSLVGIPGYDKTIAGTYDFILSAYSGTTLEAQTYMRVDVNGGTASGPVTVPDATSTGLLSAIGLGSVVLLAKLGRSQQPVG